MSDQIKEAQKMRDAWAASDAKRDEGFKRADVREMIDIPYTISQTEDEKKYHLMDIYYPQGEEKDKYPVIISIHGGGWFYGDKELYSLYTTMLATFGYAVINFNYRLSPKYKYPAGFEDVCALMDFVKENADTYSFDLERIYLVGDSAGAQLAGQYSTWANSEEYRDLFDFSNKYKVLKPRKVALNCGIYDMHTVHNRDTTLNDWYLPAEMDEKLSESFWESLKYINSDFPATYLMLSVNDDLAEHTAPMKEALIKNNIKYVFREYGHDNKDDGHVFHLNMASENGKICNLDEIKFFD